MFEAFLGLLGSGLCHQLPARSFYGGGLQLPVCARDTGTYVGFTVSLLLLAALERGRRPSEPPRPWLSGLGVAMIAVMALDGITSYAGLRTTDNSVRLLTGLTSGFAIALFLLPILNGELWASPGNDRVLQKPSDIAIWLAALALTYVVLWYLGPVAGVLYPLVTALSILLTFVAVNLLIVQLLGAVGRVGRLRDAWPGVLLALVLTFAELAVSAAMRAWLDRLA